MEGNDQAARAEDAKHRTGYYPPIRRETMTTGNPYKLSNDRVIDILELVPCGAEEALVQAGYAAGKTEQAEIVDELVGTVETACLQLGIWANTANEWDYYNLIQWMRDSREMLELAIAKAKGE